MSDYKLTRDAAGNVTTQYSQMLQRLEDDVMSDNLKERLKDMAVLAQSRTPADALQYIEELEVNLAKAVEALEGVQGFVRDLEPYADQGHTLVPALHEACETLKELNGETE